MPSLRRAAAVRRLASGPPSGYCRLRSCRGWHGSRLYDKTAIDSLSSPSPPPAATVDPRPETSNLYQLHRFARRGGAGLEICKPLVLHGCVLKRDELGGARGSHVCSSQASRPMRQDLAEVCARSGTLGAMSACKGPLVDRRVASRRQHSRHSPSRALQASNEALL